MTNLTRLFVTILAALMALLSEARPANLHEALDSLDAALAVRGAIIEKRLSDIDSLRTSPSLTPRSRVIALARAYRGLNGDSALRYYAEAISMPRLAGDTVTKNRLLIEYARQLETSGYKQAAMSYMDSVTRPALSRGELLSFYEVRSKILIDLYPSCLLPKQKLLFKKRIYADLDSLRSLVTPYPGGTSLVNAMTYALDGDTVMAAGELYEIYGKLPMQSPTFAITCGLMAEFYSQIPSKREEYLYFLAMASLADAWRGNGEAYALERLGSEILKDGDFDRALSYITISGKAIHAAGQGRRFANSEPPMAIMLNTMLERERTRQIAYITTLAILLVAIALFIISFTRLVRRERQAQQQLRLARSAADAKDRYISQLFDLCAVYIEAIEEINRLVGRKIKANQIKDLYESVESGRLVKAQTERFYEAFDRAVWNIYPDFLADVNSLLLPDKRIQLTESGVLTPELRIAAFMRLGVTDSARIAKFLGLSLNTVYTYRNRLKSRAADREKFDTLLLKID